MLAKEYAGTIDIAYEGVGGTLQQAAWDALGQKGKLLVVGYISEYPHVKNSQPDDAALSTEASLPSSDQLFWKGMTVREGDKTAYGNVWPSDPTTRELSLHKAYQMHVAGEISPLVDESRSFIGLSSVPEAVEYMLSGQALGKVCVRISA